MSILVAASILDDILAVQLTVAWAGEGICAQDKLRLDAVKVPPPHLLGVVEGRSYLFSTNGSSYNHPDREAVARVTQYGGERPFLFFNYRTDKNEIWDDVALRKNNRYEAKYPGPDEKDLAVKLA